LNSSTISWQMMEKIEITTRFTRDGTLVPLDFSLDEETIQILNIGRQWITAEGRHILVMDYGQNTYHLFFQLSDMSWYLIRDIKPGAGSI
jgi:hypothetical protein